MCPGDDLVVRGDQVRGDRLLGRFGGVSRANVVGVRLDGVLVAGDMVNVADRASDWFDAGTGPAFFAAMTGRARTPIAGRTYRGAPLLQHTPLFPALGNHEVMGRWSGTASLESQFHDPQPRELARERWRAERSAGRVGPDGSGGPESVRQGDPGGLTPVVPTVAPLTGPTGAPLPYVASNDITVFSGAVLHAPPP
ncbi:hypothetical protein ACN27G_14540 [Plantactinospora sp. WMMB334]|uniref:hypothetical protein n=1 Tax=Plantactinospora sp. WMMB334 TaxID=3404119 RepID=UPI003B964032